MNEPRDIADYLAMLRRRFLYILFPALIVGGAAVAVALLLPPSYEATATILVESQQIRTDLASSTVTANADERIQAIRQRLMTRENLLAIADKYDLYAYAGAGRTPATIVDNLRAGIAIEQLSSGVTSRRDVGVLGFSVAFTYRDATIASRVTNELVSSILSQNIETRLSSASDTTSFFTKQQADVEKQLLELEAKIAEFKRTNDADLPETMAARRLQATLLSERIATIDSQLRLGSAPLVTDDAGVEQLGFTLRAKQLELDGLVKERDRVAPLAEDGFVAKNKLDDLDQNIALAQLNIESINAKIAAAGGVVVGEDGTSTLKAQRDELEAQLSEISKSILRTPGVEVTLNAMLRDYETLQNRYVQVNTKLQEASVGERLEEDRQAERFEVIEQATVPEQPVQPNRPRIVLLGSLGGVAAGIGLALLLEIVSKTVYSARDLERTLGLRPIVTIPYVTTSGETWRRNARRAVVLTVAVAALGAGLLIVHLYVTPIDLLGDRVVAFARRTLSRQFGA